MSAVSAIADHEVVSLGLTVTRDGSAVTATATVTAARGTAVTHLILDWFQKWSETQGVPTRSDFERVLRGAALRVTHPRVAVMCAVQDRPHADTYSIIGVVREDLGAVADQVRYDVLRGLTAAGLSDAADESGYQIEESRGHHRAEAPGVPRRPLPRPTTGRGHAAVGRARQQSPSPAQPSPRAVSHQEESETGKDRRV